MREAETPAEKPKRSKNSRHKAREASRQGTALAMAPWGWGGVVWGYRHMMLSGRGGMVQKVPG